MRYWGNDLIEVEVSVVLPVYNNADCLLELQKQISEVLCDLNLSYEVVYVNDQSPDHSAEVLRDLYQRYKTVSVLELPSNRGQQRAILAGVAKAKGKYTAVMDADLQDSPSYMPALLKKLTPPYHAIFALREGQYQEKGKMLTSLIFKSVIQFLSGLPRSAGSYFILDQTMKQQLLKMNCRQPYTTIMIACSGLKIGGVPVKRDKRNVGASSYSFQKRIKAGLKGIFCILECKLQ